MDIKYWRKSGQYYTLHTTVDDVADVPNKIINIYKEFATLMAKARKENISIVYRNQTKTVELTTHNIIFKDCGNSND